MPEPSECDICGWQDDGDWPVLWSVQRDPFGTERNVCPWCWTKTNHPYHMNGCRDEDRRTGPLWPANVTGLTAEQRAALMEAGLEARNA
jgi:hypothetical protein